MPHSSHSPSDQNRFEGVEFCHLDFSADTMRTASNELEYAILDTRDEAPRSGTA
jgi:hypothetical protein